jgi:hypothetical protein
VVLVIFCVYLQRWLLRDQNAALMGVCWVLSLEAVSQCVAALLFMFVVVFLMRHFLGWWEKYVATNYLRNKWRCYKVGNTND